MASLSCRPVGWRPSGSATTPCWPRAPFATCRGPRTDKRDRPAQAPAGSLLARLETYRAVVLRFATNVTVAFDYNQAERDLRMVKLRQKICGGWRSDTWAEAFRDVSLQTWPEREVVLRKLFTGHPWIQAIGASS